MLAFETCRMVMAHMWTSKTERHKSSSMETALAKRDTDCSSSSLSCRWLMPSIGRNVTNHLTLLARHRLDCDPPWPLAAENTDTKLRGRPRHDRTVGACIEMVSRTGSRNENGAAPAKGCPVSFPACSPISVPWQSQKALYRHSWGGKPLGIKGLYGADRETRTLSNPVEPAASQYSCGVQSAQVSDSVPRAFPHING